MKHNVCLCFAFSGAGPHPKGLSGRVVSAVWWVFAVVLLAFYFSNFNAMLRSDSKHVSVNNFEELAKQDVIDYGTVEGGSTFNFFKVCVALKRKRNHTFIP